MNCADHTRKQLSSWSEGMRGRRLWADVITACTLEDMTVMHR